MSHKSWERCSNWLVSRPRRDGEINTSNMAAWFCRRNTSCTQGVIEHVSHTHTSISRCAGGRVEGLVREWNYELRVLRPCDKRPPEPSFHTLATWLVVARYCVALTTIRNNNQSRLIPAAAMLIPHIWQSIKTLLIAGDVESWSFNGWRLPEALFPPFSPSTNIFSQSFPPSPFFRSSLTINTSPRFLRRRQEINVPVDRWLQCCRLAV